MVMIMLLLGLVIFFIVVMNYVLIFIFLFVWCVKVIGVYKCNGVSERNIFLMFFWEMGIIIMILLILVGVLVLNFREDIEYFVFVLIGVFFIWEILWVFICVIVILFIVVGIILGYLFFFIFVIYVFWNYIERKGGWKCILFFF